MRGFDPEDGSCECGGHAVTRRRAIDEREFWGCSNFPRCRNAESIERAQFNTALVMLGEDDPFRWDRE